MVVHGGKKKKGRGVSWQRPLADPPSASLPERGGKPSRRGTGLSIKNRRRAGGQEHLKSVNWGKGSALYRVEGKRSSDGGVVTSKKTGKTHPSLKGPRNCCRRGEKSLSSFSNGKTGTSQKKIPHTHTKWRVSLQPGGGGKPIFLIPPAGNTLVQPLPGGRVP